jgi:hypothetical protein
MTRLVHTLLHPGLFTCKPELLLGQLTLLLSLYYMHSLIVEDHEGHTICDRQLELLGG